MAADRTASEGRAGNDNASDHHQTDHRWQQHARDGLRALTLARERGPGRAHPRPGMLRAVAMNVLATLILCNFVSATILPLAVLICD